MNFEVNLKARDTRREEVRKITEIQKERASLSTKPLWPRHTHSPEQKTPPARNLAPSPEVQLKEYLVELRGEILELKDKLNYVGHCTKSLLKRYPNNMDLLAINSIAEKYL